MAQDFKCVIFDFDDTLADTAAVVKKIRSAVIEQKILKKQGYDFTKKQVIKALALMDKQAARMQETERIKNPIIFAQFFLENLGLKPSLKLAELCEKNFQLEKKKRIRLFPNAKRVLDFLKAKKKTLCVITNASNNSNRRIAQKLGIKKYFKHFYSSHSHGGLKRDLKIFQNLLKQLNKNAKQKIRPEECLMVGNHVGDDGAAKLVGMKVALLKPTLKGKEHLKKLKPDFMLNDLKDIERIVK
ncbi:MAG: HAD family hydrolase [Candidatus Diapherotrites archaeon]|nr:HAD family hydrolase [Candidatus Diapherotrites archaeon]